MPSAEHLITAAEFARMPSEPACELVRGRLVEVPPAGGEHGVVCANVTALVWTFVRRHDLGTVSCNDTGHWIARNPDTVRGPDVGFVAKERIPAEGLPKRWWEFSPDLVVEVISPSDTYSRVEDRTRDWLDGGAREIWLVDPRRREVKVVSPDSLPRTFGEGATLTSGVLPGFETLVSELFRA